VDTGS